MNIFNHTFCELRLTLQQHPPFESITDEEAFPLSVEPQLALFWSWTRRRIPQSHSGFGLWTTTTNPLTFYNVRCWWNWANVLLYDSIQVKTIFASGMSWRTNTMWGYRATWHGNVMENPFSVTTLVAQWQSWKTLITYHFSSWILTVTVSECVVGR